VGKRSSVLGFVAAVAMVGDLPYDLIGLHPRRPCALAFVGDFSDFAPTRLVERMADTPGRALRQKQRERGRNSNPNPNQHDTRPSPNLFLMDYPISNTCTVGCLLALPTKARILCLDSLSSVVA